MKAKMSAEIKNQVLNATKKQGILGIDDIKLYMRVIHPRFGAARFYKLKKLLTMQ